MAAQMKYLFGFPATYGKTPLIYIYIYIDVYISAVERLTLDAEENDLQHVLRAARAGLRKTGLKETQTRSRPGQGATAVFRSAQSYWITVTQGRIKLLLS